LAAREADHHLRLPGADIKVHEPLMARSDENTLTPLDAVVAMDGHAQTKLV
jgi:hypothetical protein